MSGTGLAYGRTSVTSSTLKTSPMSAIFNPWSHQKEGRREGGTDGRRALRQYRGSRSKRVVRQVAAYAMSVAIA
eukprot:127489-Rhodomonas_salina.1